MGKLPQRLVNVRVRDRARDRGRDGGWAAVERSPRAWRAGAAFWCARPGTEQLVRVMVEAPTEEECEEVADRLANLVDNGTG